LEVEFIVRSEVNLQMHCALHNGEIAAGVCLYFSGIALKVVYIAAVYRERQET